MNNIKTIMIKEVLCMQIKKNKNLLSLLSEQKRETIFTLLPNGKIKRHRVRKQTT